MTQSEVLPTAPSFATRGDAPHATLILIRVPRVPVPSQTTDRWRGRRHDAEPWPPRPSSVVDGPRKASPSTATRSPGRRPVVAGRFHDRRGPGRSALGLERRRRPGRSSVAQPGFRLGFSVTRPRSDRGRSRRRPARAAESIIAHPWSCSRSSRPRPFPTLPPMPRPSSCRAIFSPTTLRRSLRMKEVDEALARALRAARRSRCTVAGASRTSLGDSRH